jgi:NAD(P)-dependent dehydrogenase (short-subunit alcohol dehydrogenase family)
MSDPVVLVTGTSSGIGLATVVAAAGAGYRVVATVRRLDSAQALRAAAADAGVEVDLRVLDVTDPVSVAGCVQGIIAAHGRLDAVVNNAGAAHIGTLEIDDPNAVRATMEVNFFGVLAVSRAAMPHLRAGRGRLITVTSVGGVIGQPFNEAYCAAKFAIEGYLESLAPVAAQAGVTVAVVEPGAVASSFVANAGLDPEAMIAQAGPYAPALAAYIARATSGSAATSAQTPAEAAAVVLQVLTAANPPFRTQTSDSARTFVAAKLADLDGEVVQRHTTTWVTPG